MLFPHGLKIEKRATQQGLQEGETPGMRDSSVSFVVVWVAGKYPARVLLCVLVTIRLDNAWSDAY